MEKQDQVSDPLKTLNQLKTLASNKDDIISNLLNPKNPLASLRTFISMGNVELITPLLEKINILADGGELIQAALQNQKDDMLKLFIQRGARVDNPPDTVTKTLLDTKGGSDQYRKSPFIVQGACWGDLNCFKTLISQGCRINETGFICLSKKKHNQVISNVIGAAAYHGSLNILKYLTSKLNEVQINFAAFEKQDIGTKGTFKKEFTGFTPLMLAVANGDKNMEIVKILLQAKADISLKDPSNNNLLHIASKYESVKLLEYLLLNSRLDVMERNLNGETPLSIAQTYKNQALIDVLAKHEHVYDDTKKNTQALLDEMEKEEMKAQQSKQKKKDKKKRQKLKNLADKEGLSLEELEIRLQEEREKEKLLEEEQRRLEEERTIIEEQRLEEEKQEKARALKKKLEEEEKKKAKIQRLTQEISETTFTHLRVKKPLQSEYKPPVVKEIVVEKKQEVKEVEQENKLNRKQRKLIIRKEEYEKRKQKKEAAEQEDEDLKKDEDIDESEDESSEPDQQIFGLESEMKLKSLASKKAKRRLRKKMQKQQEEEDQIKEKLKKVHEQKEAEKIRQENEELERQQKEEEERTKKYKYFRETPKPQYRIKNKDEEKNIYSVKTKPAQLYRPKPKKQDDKVVEEVIKDKIDEVKETEDSNERKNINFFLGEVDEDSDHEVKKKDDKEAKLDTPPSSPLIQKDIDQKTDSQVPQPFHMQPILLNSDVALGHISQLQQLMFMKDQQIQTLNEKVTYLETLTLKLQESNKNQNEGQLQKQVQENADLILKLQSLKEDLGKKEKVIEEKDQQLKALDEKYQKFIKEQSQQKQQNGYNKDSEKQLLDMANEELRKKGKQQRDLKRKIDLYEGRKVEGVTKAELQQTIQQIQQSLLALKGQLDSH